LCGDDFDILVHKLPARRIGYLRGSRGVSDHRPLTSVKDCNKRIGYVHFNFRSKVDSAPLYVYVCTENT